MPYGTDLWQMGDLAEQNGTLNMCSTRANAEIVQKNEALSLPPVIEPYEIIPIINVAWGKSFGDVSTNKKAVVERGW